MCPMSMHQNGGNQMNNEEDIAHFSSPEKPRRNGPYASILSKRPNASQQSALLSGRSEKPVISTGLTPLDAALSVPVQPSQPLLKPSNVLKHRTLAISGAGSVPPGLRRREVTEVTGPRGIGKTLLAMEAAANVLKSGQKVVWIDTAGPINRKRFQDVLHKGQPSGSRGQSLNEDEVLHGLLHFHPPTLSHLLALISNPPLGFPPADTGLIVIDSISSLFRAEFRTKLRPSATNNAGTAGGPSVQDPVASPSLSERRSARWNIKEEKLRWRVIGNILESLKKLSVVYDCAIIVTNEMATRFRPNQKPMLHESLSGPTWDVGIGTKLVLYWMWLPEEVRTQIYSQAPQAVRIAEILKVGKVPVDGKRKGRVIPFMILKDGLHPFTTEPNLTVIPLEPRHERSSPMPQPPKRKLEQYDSPTRTKFETPMSRLAYYTSSPARSPLLRNPRPFLDAAAAAEFAEGTEKAEEAEMPTGNEQQTEVQALSSQSYIADFAAGSNTEQKDSTRKGGAEEGNPQHADTANTSVPSNEQKAAEPIVYDSCDEESITSDMFET